MTASAYNAAKSSLSKHSLPRNRPFGSSPSVRLPFLHRLRYGHRLLHPSLLRQANRRRQKPSVITSLRMPVKDK